MNYTPSRYGISDSLIDSIKTILENKKSVWSRGKYIHKDDTNAPTWIRPLSDEEKEHNNQMLRQWVSDATKDEKTHKMSSGDIEYLKDRTRNSGRGINEKN